MDLSINLASLVLAKIEALGLTKAAEYFQVTLPTVSAWKSGKHFPNLLAGQRVLDELCHVQPPHLWDITGKKVLVLLPVYRTFNAVTHICLFRNYSVYGADKIGVIPKLRTLIVEGRNLLVKMALSTDAEFFIFCDDDMAPPCGNGAMLRGMGVNLPEPNASMNAISRLMSHPPEYKIVGALYFGRNETNIAQNSNGFESALQNARYHEIKRQGGDYPLEEVRWVGTGFVRYHRSIFEEMIARADELFPSIKPSQPGRHYGFFTPDGPDRGEDMILCLRAGLCGIKTYLDPSLIVGHLGEASY